MIAATTAALNWTALVYFLHFHTFSEEHCILPFKISGEG